MRSDSLAYDSLESRPLPQWLTDQKSGVTTIQPEELVMKQDHSLKISLFASLAFILLAVIVWTVYLNKKQKNQEP